MRGFIIFLLILCTLCVHAAAEEAQDITAECNITLQNGKRPSALFDGDIKSYFTAKKGNNCLTVVLPEGIEAGGMQVEWYAEPDDYVFTLCDALDNIIAEKTNADHFPCICQYFEFTPETRYVKLNLSIGQRIVGMTVYSSGTLPDDVQLWQPPVEKADIMLICAHQDDEELWFGGTIPYYDVQQDCDMIVVYMTNCGRLRRAEALKGLWAMGVRTYPEFLNKKDMRSETYKAGVALWGGKAALTGTLAEVIRKYKPEVIVTHDINGEYGHIQHRILSDYVLSATEAAADPSIAEESYEKYGAWQVKKLYRHLGSENTISMDWDTPSEKLGGLTPLEVASIGFNAHESQHKRWTMERGKIYDNTKFSLVYSTVGEDIYKDDMLENTPSDLRTRGTAES